MTHILFEDDHFIAAVKPENIPTHAAVSGEMGFVEMLSAEKNIKLGVHQRLDAATSGVIVFSKTPQGAKRLAAAFELRNVKKTYRALVCGIPENTSGEWSHRLVHRDGLTLEDPSGKLCKSRYRVVKTYGPFALLELDLLTGMTHQLRVQCALSGHPILGDSLYGGGELAPRLCLHAHRLRLLSEPNLPTFEAPLPALLNRPTVDAILQPILKAAFDVCKSLPATEAIRLVSPQHSGIPEIILEKIGDSLLLRHLEPAASSLWTEGALRKLIELAMHAFQCSDFAYRIHENPGKTHPCRAFERAFSHEMAPFSATEHGLKYTFDLSGNATGLYLDQRDNRRWVIDHARGSVLNLFAYTCAFSVCAARNPDVTSTTSIDAAGAALRRGRENFTANDISTDGHRFMTEDVLKYLNRCLQNGTRYDTIICDPPSFGRSGKIVFSLDDALEELIDDCVAVASPNAVLMFSVNHRKIRLQRLKTAFKEALSRHKRTAENVEIFVNDDALGPLGVGTDLKTIRAIIR